MGTIIVSIILIAIVTMVIASIIKDKRSGRHPSCGGHCASCDHNCSELYKNVNSFLKNQKSDSHN